MTNSEKFKTAQERAEAFLDWCVAKTDYSKCRNCVIVHDCDCCPARGIAYWLDLEAEEEKPLPCPCCGADAEIHYEDDVEREGDASVQCKGCFLMTPDYPSDVEAVMAWNKRMSNQERK